VRKAQTPTLMFVVLDLTIPLNQVPNICTILRGGIILKAM
jgi:hypothetical protein